MAIFYISNKKQRAIVNQSAHKAIKPEANSGQIFLACATGLTASQNWIWTWRWELQFEFELESKSKTKSESMSAQYACQMAGAHWILAGITLTICFKQFGHSAASWIIPFSLIAKKPLLRLAKICKCSETRIVPKVKLTVRADYSLFTWMAYKMLLSPMKSIRGQMEMLPVRFYHSRNCQIEFYYAS